MRSTLLCRSALSLDLPNRADERGKLHPVDMSEALRNALVAAGAGTAALEMALKCMADAMTADGVRDALDYLRNTKDQLSLDEAHAYLSHALRIVRAL